MNAAAPLAELHVHLAGAVRADALLEHLASLNPEALVWEDYEAAMTRAYGSVPPARELVAAYRAGDQDVRPTFSDVFVMGTTDAGDFGRFSAKYELLFVGSDRSGDVDAARAEIAAFLAGIRLDHARQGIDHAELRILLGPDLRTLENSAVLEPPSKDWAPTMRSSCPWIEPTRGPVGNGYSSWPWNPSGWAWSASTSAPWRRVIRPRASHRSSPT